MGVDHSDSADVAIGHFSYVFSRKLGGRKILVDIQVGVVIEIRQGNLIPAGYVETEPAGGEIGSRQGPPVENEPCISLPDLVDDFGGGHMNLQGAIALLIALVRNFCLVRLLTVADVGAIEIVVVDLKQIVIARGRCS